MGDTVSTAARVKPQSKGEMGCPKRLSRKGRDAYRTIMGAMRHWHAITDLGDVWTGGCTTFYSPQEWRDRGETYGCSSVLVVVYDGGDVRKFFDPDEEYEAEEFMRQALEEKGYWPERQTHWYSAIWADKAREGLR